jgi:hypothetical protein
MGLSGIGLANMVANPSPNMGVVVSSGRVDINPSDLRPRSSCRSRANATVAIDRVKSVMRRGQEAGAPQLLSPIGEAPMFRSSEAPSGATVNSRLPGDSCGNGVASIGRSIGLLYRLSPLTLYIAGLFRGK